MCISKVSIDHKHQYMFDNLQIVLEIERLCISQRISASERDNQTPVQERIYNYLFIS